MSFPLTASAKIFILVLTIMFGTKIYLVIVISSGQGFQTIRCQLAARGVELLSVVLGQLGPEGVDRDDERPGLGRFQGEYRQVGVCTSCQPQRRESRT